MDRKTYLGDALFVLPAEQRGPRDAARVLALEEERLGLAVLEAEDLAVAADVEFALRRGGGWFVSSCSLCGGPYVLDVGEREPGRSGGEEEGRRGWGGAW